MNVTPVNNYLVPATGTTNSVPVVGNFTASPTRVDFREVELNGVQFVPSGVFIDNSAGVGPLTIAIESMSGFSVVCQPGQRIARQYPAPIDQIVNITGNGAGIVIFVDFPVIPSTDTVAGSASAVTIANGADVAEGNTGDAAVTNPANPGTVIGLLKGIITSLFGVGANSQNVQGNLAAAVADVGNPLKVGGVFNSTLPTYVDGQRTNAQTDVRGGIYTVVSASGVVATVQTNNADGQSVNSGSLGTRSFAYVFNGTTWDRQRGDLFGTIVQSEFRNDWSYAAVAGGIVNTTAVAIKNAAGAGVINFLTSITIHNTAAVASEFLILNGVTVIWRGNVPASMTAPQVITFPRPLRSSANAALNVQLSTTATATFVNAQGFAQ